jgi:hypothetical protein
MLNFIAIATMAEQFLQRHPRLSLAIGGVIHYAYLVWEKQQ